MVAKRNNYIRLKGRIPTYLASHTFERLLAAGITKLKEGYTLNGWVSKENCT
jgi:hypothetical protein